MKIWVDAQLSPTLAEWLTQFYDIQASAPGDLSLLDPNYGHCPN